jgi:hypothetical protein
MRNIVTTRNICQDMNCGVCRTGTDASEGRGGATSRAGALHPGMVTANDDDDDASSAAKGSRVGLWY